MAWIFLREEGCYVKVSWLTPNVTCNFAETATVSVEWEESWGVLTMRDHSTLSMIIVKGDEKLLEDG